MTRKEEIARAAKDYHIKQHPNFTYREYVAFIDGAEWADSHPANLWKDAQGDELPDYDREVVALIQDYPDDEEHLRVAYGHRPNPNGYVTKDGERLYPMTYGKGGWNGKNVRYWLDVKLPNQDEL